MTSEAAEDDGMTGMEMIEGYGFWHQSKQVRNLINFLHAEFPLASELQLRNHVLNYTMVKLVVWLVPKDEDKNGSKEPWEM